MNRPWTREAALLKAFELAQFLCPQRSAALATTRRALATLDVAVAVQVKRLYYRPRRRSGNQDPLRRKVFLCEAHLLQRLVCAEAERTATFDDQRGFTVSFLTSIVRRALERNSFHTALAASRVIHEYSTREGMVLYTAVIHDPRRVRSEDYWRSRKQQYMSELKQRYGERLALRRRAQGEERFVTVDNVRPLVPLVRETLAALTPWDTPCPVPEQLDTVLHGVPHLAWSGDTAEDGREVQRMHALLHPSCFERLVKAADLDSPAARLAIPQLMCSNGDEDKAGRRSSSPLDESEQEALLSDLANLSRRRREAPGACLRLLVDGIERGRLEPERGDTCRVAIGPEATRLEVVTSDAAEDDPLLLAWLPLERHGPNETFRELRRTLTLEGGQRLTFIITPQPAADPEQPPAAEILLRYQETALKRRLALSLRRLRARTSAVTQSSLVRPVLVSAALVGLAMLVFRQIPQPSPTSMKTSSPSGADIPARRLLPPSTPEEESVKRDRRAPSDGPTRSLKPRPVGVDLAEVHALWLDVSAATLAHDMVVQQIGDRLAASGFALVDGPEEADAALEVQLVGADAPEDARSANVRLRLRVVNAAGVVLWPASGSPRIYRGSLSRAASQMARELSSAVAAARKTQIRRSDPR